MYFSKINYQRHICRKVFFLFLLLVVNGFFSGCSITQVLSEEKQEIIKKSNHGYLTITIPEGLTNQNFRQDGIINVKVDGEKYFFKMIKNSKKNIDGTFKIPVPEGRHNIKFQVVLRDFKISHVTCPRF